MTYAMKRRLIVIIATLSASKHAISGAVMTGAAAMTLAPALGFDPWTWFFSGFGAVVGHFKTIAKTRIDATINGVIGVILGGLGGPYAVSIVLKYEFPAPPIQLCAFLLALTWPWLLKFGIDIVNRKKDTL